MKVGIYRESGHEHFNGSLIVPIFDAQGQVVEVYGRKRRDDLRPGTPKHLYLPGPHRGVWNLAALQASSEIILCEALIDALTKAKPASSKGQYLRKIAVSSTMGPGVRVDSASL